MLAFAVFSFFHCNLELIPLQQKVLENAHTVPSWVQTEKKDISYPGKSKGVPQSCKCRRSRDCSRRQDVGNNQVSEKSETRAGGLLLLRRAGFFRKPGELACRKLIRPPSPQSSAGAGSPILAHTTLFVTSSSKSSKLSKKR